MMIKPGELVALVGRTGAGKSTVTRMLLAFERPLSGQILFDGKDLAGLDPTLVRGQMGVVMQSGTHHPWHRVAQHTGGTCRKTKT